MKKDAAAHSDRKTKEGIKVLVAQTNYDAPRKSRSPNDHSPGTINEEVKEKETVNNPSVHSLDATGQSKPRNESYNTGILSP